MYGGGPSDSINYNRSCDLVKRVLATDPCMQCLVKQQYCTCSYLGGVSCA